MHTSILREVFQQVAVLRRFLSGSDPLPDVKGELLPGLFLTARSRDNSKPDYFFRNALHATVGRWATWADAVDGALTGMGEHFFDPMGAARIHVKYERFAEWQHLVAEVSPLAIVSGCLLEKYGPPPRQAGLRPITEYVRDCVQPQFRTSALATVYDPRIDRIAEATGLDDLHIHLNGSTEMEVIWLEALMQPSAFARAFLKSASDWTVRELLSQMEPGLTHETVVARLRVAQRIQRTLARLILPPLIGDDVPEDLLEFNAWEIVDLEAIDLEAIRPIAGWPYRERMHPVQALLGPLEGASLLTMEALLLMASLDAMRRQVHPAIDKLIYVYLSLMVQFGRLIVQGRDQIGFDQFQKITMNEIREEVEGRDFKARLHQVQHSPKGDLETLELRIAPKDTPVANLRLLGRLDKAYGEYLAETGFPRQTAASGPGESEIGTQGERGARQSPLAAAALHRSLEVNVVCHFIKRQDKRDVSVCRHYMLRRKIAAQRRAFWAALRTQKGQNLQVPIVGFDAASNELHAPPEVFAPLFRKIRSDGYVNFTYHVGEDFVHLVSGIRAIVEAAEYLELTPGNRLGHATAVGVSPSLWRERMGGVTTIGQGEWLDNLVFARTVLMRCGKAHLCPRLDEQIASLVSRLYGVWHSPDLLYRAWEMRHLDPLIALGLDGRLEDTLDAGSRAEFERCRTSKSRDPDAYRLFEDYHSAEVVKRGNEWVQVVYEERSGPAAFSPQEWIDPFTAEAFSELQRYALDLLERRRLVLETLPTSNVRIHIYDDYREHHLFRWLGFENSPVKMPIVVGTDDPGIFATCMRNEYTHILRELDSLCADRSVRSEEILERLIRNGKTWRFRKTPLPPL